MSNLEAVAGVHSYALYGKETTFNTAVAVNTHLSDLVHNVKFTVNPNTNFDRGFAGSASGGRKVVKSAPGKLDIDVSADFDVTVWDFLEFLLGSVSGTTTKTFTEANSLPSMTFASNISNPGGSPTNQEDTFSGVLWDSCTVKCSVGEPVSASLSGKAALVAVDTSVSSNQALPGKSVFNFTGGSITLAGSPLGNIIDSVELSIKNNVEMIYGVGSRLAQYGVVKALEYSLKFTVKYLDNVLITAALGATTPTATGTPTQYATVVLTFATADSRSNTMTFTVADVSQFSQMLNLNEIISEDVEVTPWSLTSVYVV